MISIEEIKEVKNENGFWIKVNENAEKIIKEKFFELFVDEEKEEYLNFLEKSDIIYFLKSNVEDADEILHILKLEEKLEAKYNINVKEIFKEVIKKDDFRYIFIERLITVLEKLNLNKEEKNEILEKRLEKENENQIFNFINDITILISNPAYQQYREIVIKKLNEKINDILLFLYNNWGDFEKIGRGLTFEDVKELLLELNKLKDYITYENKNKIKEFLLNNNIEKIIKRRIKNPAHQNYLKAILNFLPPEIANKYFTYLIVNEL